MKKILFLAGGYPMYKNAGSVLYKSIIETYGQKNFCYFSLGDDSENQIPDWFVEVPHQKYYLRLPNSSFFNKLLKKIPFLEEILFFIKIKKAVNAISEFINLNDIDLIFAVYRGDVLSVINQVIIKNKFPLYGYISDTVEAEYNDKKIIYQYKVKEYIKGIKNADGIYVAGEAMEFFIKTNFQKPTSILRPAYNLNFQNRSNYILIQKEIKVFFSGSVYAKNELECFVEVLSNLSNKHKNISFTLTLASLFVLKNKPKNIKIIELGWVNEEELIEVMQDSNIAYLPYKFEEVDKIQMTYAFPGKTGFYLSSGLPIFFHGPKYASMSYFFDKYQCGFHCSSMNIVEIQTDFENFIFNKSNYQNCIIEAKKAFVNEFSIEVLKSSFKKLIV